MDSDKSGRKVWTLVLLVVDLLLVTGAFFQLLFVVPTFRAIYVDFGVTPPVLTQILFDLSSALVSFRGVGCGLLYSLVVALILWMYFSLQRSDNRRGLFTRLWLVFSAVVVLVAIMTAVMFMPTFVVTEAIGDPGAGVKVDR